MASELSAAVASATSSNYTHGLEAFAREFGDGDLVVAARRSDAVRYIVVACLTIALMDRVLLLNRELKKIWSGPMSFPKFFYFLNRYPNLCCVGLDVFVFTQRVSNRSDCVWWFTFRAWAAIFVSTCLEALLVFKLWQLFGKCKYILYGFSTLGIAQTIGTSFLVRPRSRCVKSAPIPGEWFSGCFPLFTNPHAVAHEWISLTAVISAMTFAALVWTINTWRKNRDASLWEIAKEKSIFHIIGLCATSLFCAAFFLTAPQPLSSIIPSVSSTMFSVFGCRIAIEMPDYSNSHLLRNLPRGDYELDDIDESTGRRRKSRPDDIESANGSSKGDRFSEVSNLDIIKPVGATVGSNHGPPTTAAITPGALDISPLSQAATLVPVPTIEIRGGEGSRGVQPTGEFRSSEVTLSSDEAQPVEQAATKTPAASRRSTLVGGATLKSSSNERPPFQVVPILDSTLEPEARGPRPGPTTSSPAVKTSAAPTGQNQQEGHEDDDDFDELDRKLAEEYDEHGRRRPPRRTHQRQWKSEAFSGLPPMLSGQGFLIPRASSPLSSGRPASAIYYHSPRPMVFPLEPSAAPSGSQSPSTSSRRRSAERSVSPRSRMSLFFHRHHRNDVGPVSVPEGEVPGSFAVPPSPVTENPTAQSPIRRHSTSSSAKSSARGRMRRLLLSGSSSPSSPPPTSSSTPLPPQLPSSPSTPSPIASARLSNGRRRDSDAMTICSVSTGFAFDNTGTYEAPDFN